MLAIIKYQLGHLTDFSGRDARPTFWWWVLIVVVLHVLAGMLVSVPMMASSMGSAFSQAASGADPEALQAEMLRGMSDWMGVSLWASVATALVAMLLTIAAFVRRLHDSGQTGWWALIPVATQIASAAIGFRAGREIEAMLANASSMTDMQSFQADMVGQVGPWSAIGYVGYLVVVGFGVLKSQEGANRYGDAPMRLTV